jgi:hypothetical protein
MRAGSVFPMDEPGCVEFRDFNRLSSYWVGLSKRIFSEQNLFSQHKVSSLPNII